MPGKKADKPKHYSARVRDPADTEKDPLRTTVTLKPASSLDGAYGGKGVEVEFGPHAQGWMSAATEPLELYLCPSETESIFAGTLYRTTDFTQPGDPPYQFYLEESGELIALVYGEDET